MTREQQLEVIKILKRDGGGIDGCSRNLSENMRVYTTTIDALREQEAQIFYNSDEKRMQISNWNEDLMKEPEKPKESATRMEVRGFRDRARIELVKAPDDQYTYHHDDIHIVVDGKDLGYMHIWNDSLSWWPANRTVHSNQTIRLTKDC